METVTIYNLDDIFYRIGEMDITVWSVNNILTSAVGRKIIYELKNTQNKDIITIEEPNLQKELANGKLVETLDELRKILNHRIEDIIKNVEETKKQFMKSRLKRTLNGKPIKAENGVKDIKEKIEKPDNEIKDVDVNVVDDVIEESKDLAEKIIEEDKIYNWKKIIEGKLKTIEDEYCPQKRPILINKDDEI